MLQAADVLKIKCNFVSSTIDYFTKLKYIVNPCEDELIQAYQKYALSSIMFDCLSYEDNCELQQDTVCMDTVLPCPPPTIIPCIDQTDINITGTTNSCTTSYSLKNPVDTTATFRIGVLNNGIYHPGSAQIIATNACTNEKTYYNITTGCYYNVGTTNYDCTPSVRNQGIITWTLNTAGNIDGYIKTIRLGHVDYSNNIVSPVNVDYNIDPTNPASMTMWNSCPTCVPIVTGNLVVSNPNFNGEFKKLLENVSRTLWDGDVNLQVEVIGDPNSWKYFKCWVKHNPSGPWMGFNKDNFTMTWAPKGVGNKTVKLNYTPNFDILIGDSFTSLFYKVEHTTPCETDLFYVSYTGLGVNLNKPACNFYKYIVNTPNMTFASAPVDLSYYNTTCYSMTITANVTGSMTSLEWRNPSNVVISTTPTITVSESGLYTVNVFSDNGCLNTASINVIL